MSARERHGMDLVLAIVAIAALAPPTIIWLASLTGGFVATGRPVSLTLAGALAVVVNLPAHLASPALAWPAGVRHDLPDAIVLDAVVVVCGAVVLGGVALAVAFVARHLHRDDPHRSAQWADRDELTPLHTLAPQAGRITLGEYNGTLISAQARTSVLVVGPSQSGKTTGLVVPAILEWQGPVVSTSVKADVVRDTHLARAALGDVLVFDPTACCKTLEHTPWSPIAAARSWEGARRTAANLLGVGDPSHAHNPDETFWRPAAARYLAPLLLAAQHGNNTMSELLSWVARVDQDEPKLLLRDCPTDGAEAGLEALQSVWKGDSKFLSNLTQTVATALDAWQEPLIAKATAGDSQISAERLLERAHTLYLIAPAHEQRRLRGLFTALVADVTAAAFERSASTGKAINPPLLLALDEVANIAPLPNLDEIASTGPGQGVQLLTVIQNISQAADRWGRDRAETIIANHRARLFCSGIGDRATLDYLAHTLGDEELGRVSTTRDTALESGSHTYSTDFRPLAAPHRVRQADTSSALLVYGNLAPAWLALRPWYANAQLNELVTIGIATPPAPPLSSRLAAAALGLTHAKRATPAAGAEPVATSEISYEPAVDETAS
jgi:type IV secretion system protein VirD4